VPDCNVCGSRSRTFTSWYPYVTLTKLLYQHRKGREHHSLIFEEFEFKAEPGV